MFIDACRNEGIGGKGDVIEMRDYQGIITFYSCSAKELSYEIKELQQGAFTYVLLEALQSGKSKCLTIGKLERYLIEQVPSLNHRYGKPIQRPLARVQPTGKRNLILFGTPLAAEIDELKLAAYKAETEGHPELAKKFWIQVNIAAQGRDATALSALVNRVLTDREKELLRLDQSEHDLKQLKLDAYTAKTEHNLELARERWIKAHIAAKGDDREVLDNLSSLREKIIIKKTVAPLPEYLIQLNEYLQAGNWREADQQTLRIILDRLGSKDIKDFPRDDLLRIDELWRKHSNDRLGFSVQKRILNSLRHQNRRFNRTILQEFGDRVGWRVNDDWLEYNKFSFTDVPEGHFPSLREPSYEPNWYGLWKKRFQGILSRLENS